MLRQQTLVCCSLLILTQGALGAIRAFPEDRELLKCANLVYAVSKSSVCFSSRFLDTVSRETNCEPEQSFTAIKLASGDMYDYPFAVMTGEGRFALTEQERRVLKSYLTRGGFLLASAGCSSQEWDQSFRQEIKRIFPKRRLDRIAMAHPIFHTVFDVKSIRLKKGGSAHLEGLVIDGKIVLVYSAEGLNDTANASKAGGQKCCCCGGNEIKNSQEINVNIFTYSLTH